MFNHCEVQFFLLKWFLLSTNTTPYVWLELKNTVAVSIPVHRQLDTVYFCVSLHHGRDNRNYWLCPFEIPDWTQSVWIGKADCPDYLTPCNWFQSSLCEFGLESRLRPLVPEEMSARFVPRSLVVPSGMELVFAAFQLNTWLKKVVLHSDCHDVLHSKLAESGDPVHIFSIHRWYDRRFRL